jgi:hypothetical protein
VRLPLQSPGGSPPHYHPVVKHVTSSRDLRPSNAPSHCCDVTDPRIPTPMSSHGLRAVLALLLIGTFGFRILAPGTMPECAAGAGYAQHSGHGQDAGHGHHDHGSPLPKCECVGHSCSVAAASLGTVLTLVGPQNAHTPVLRPESARLPGSDPDHLLPFAHGPPPPLPA